MPSLDKTNAQYSQINNIMEYQISINEIDLGIVLHYLFYDWHSR